MWHKGVRWHHVESIFLKEGPGPKHPGRLEIAEHQIPSIKVLFEINIKSHKHPSIKPFIGEQDTIGKPKKTKSGIQPRNRALPRDTVLYNVMVCSFTNTEWHSCCMDIYDLNRTHIKNIYIYINTDLLDGNKGHQEETHHPSHMFRRLLLDLLPMGWRGSNSHPPVWVQNSYVNQFI